MHGDNVFFFWSKEYNFFFHLFAFFFDYLGRMFICYVIGIFALVILFFFMSFYLRENKNENDSFLFIHLYQRLLTLSQHCSQGDYLGMAC